MSKKQAPAKGQDTYAEIAKKFFNTKSPSPAQKQECKIRFGLLQYCTGPTKFSKIFPPMGNKQEAQMSTKKGKSEVVKAKTVKKEAAPINAKTGYRAGSLGDRISLAYLGETKHEAAVKAVEGVLAKSCADKGKSTKPEYVHLRAISWIGFLKVRDSKKFADLPKAEKPAVKKPVAKKAAKKPVAKKAAKPAAKKPEAPKAPEQKVETLA